MRYGLIGVPFNSAGVPGGEARAPAALRTAGLVAAIQSAGDVYDYGDLSLPEPSPFRDPTTGIIPPANLEAMIAAVRSKVSTTITQGDHPIVIGGECPILLGCLAAARDAYNKVGLFFVDGHEDAWPPRQSTTGESADMELGLALGLTTTSGLHDLEALLPLVSPRDTVVVGPRDHAELKAANIPSLASVVTYLDDKDLLATNLSATSRALMRRLSTDPTHWWFHLDLDALATESFAAVRYPQPGGLSWSDLESIATAALRTPGLCGWNITIYNPDLDPDGGGADRIVSFLETVIRNQRGTGLKSSRV